MFFIHIIYIFVPLEFAPVCKTDRRIVAANISIAKLICINKVHNLRFSVVSYSLFPLEILSKIIVMILMIRAVVVTIPNADPVAVPSLYANL